MPTENRSSNTSGWIACDDGLHLIQMDESLSHYGWVFRKIHGGLPYSVREATPHEMAHALARQHLRIGVAQVSGQAPAQQDQVEPVTLPQRKGNHLRYDTLIPTFSKGWNACLDGIAKLGPLYSRPVQGEPVYQLRNTVVGNVWRDADKEAYDSAENLAEYERRVLYTHADPGEVERLRSYLDAWMKVAARRLADWKQAVEANERQHAQLAERDALLDRVVDHANFWHDHPYAEVVEAIAKDYKALSASAEPKS